MPAREPLRLLLVEDNPADARLLQTMLDSDADSFDMQWEQSLDAGIRRLTEGGFDAMLLDLSLPDSQGIESVSTAHLFDTETPIIVITGLDDDVAAFDALRAGAHDYLVKGQIDAKQLIRSVRFARQRVELQQRLRAHHPIPADDATMRAVACPSGEEMTGLMAAHLAALQAAGRAVVYVTVDRPATVLDRHYRQHGLSMDQLHTIDASGHASAEDGRVFVPEDPRDLDALAVDIERACAALGPDACVVIDSVNSLILHHGVDPAAVFSHALANRLRLLGIPADFVGHRNQEWPFILDRFSFLDREYVLGAEGGEDPSFA